MVEQPMKTSTAWGLFFLAALVIAMITWPARSQQTAPFVKPIPTPTYKIFPPAEFDHFYEGDLTIKIVNTLEELHAVCQIENPKLLACSQRNQDSCVIVLVKDEIMRQRQWTTGMLLRHEIGHCNGWGADHAGERSISFPTPYFVHPARRVRLDR
jgi:hypothetical protein